MIQRLPAQFESVYQKYAQADRDRGDYRYLEAMHSLAEFYRRMGGDFTMLESVAEAILLEYDGKRKEVSELLEAGDFARVSRVVRELQSSIRHVVDERTLECAKAMQAAADQKNAALTQRLWESLHEKLTPVFAVLRQLKGMGA